MDRVIKRDGSVVPFCKDKIFTAIKKANREVCKADQASDRQMQYIVENIASIEDDLNVEEIQDAVESGLIEFNKYKLAKKYIIYRYRRELSRVKNTTDDSILNLVRYDNEEVMRENSNKDAYIASTQRDLIAGEVSKDLTRRVLLPENIINAHEEGILHFHDMDYFLQPIINCCLINIGDMLDNGTVMNTKLIESPKSFQVACNVMTQIIAAIACGQYGGQSVNTKHLGKYLRKSKEKFMKRFSETDPSLTKEQLEHLVKTELEVELKSGVQTIQYQINTIMSSNGQTPFVTLFLDIDPESEYADENAMIVYESLRQRLEGLKNEKGVWITPTFPKLVYPLYEENNLSGGKYDYVTKLAAKCSAKRMYPDYISTKKMKETYEGNVFSCMGCVEGAEVITYKLFGNLIVESFEKMWMRLSMYFKIKEQTKKSPNLFMDLEDVEIYDTKKGFVKCKRLIRNISIDWMRVTTKSGRHLKCTSDHPFFTTNRGRVHAKDLELGDKVIINKSQFSEDKLAVDPDVAWMLGFMICDGCYSGGHVYSSIALHGEKELTEKIKSALKRLSVKRVNENNIGQQGDYNDLIANALRSPSSMSELIAYFSGKFRAFGESKPEVPEDLFSWNKEARLSFLAGSIEAYGYIDTSSEIFSVMEIRSTNKALAIEQMLLAQSLGMPASMFLKHYDENDSEKIQYCVEFKPTEELINYITCGEKKSDIVTPSEIIQDDEDAIIDIESLDCNEFSYDVTTESDFFEVSGMYSHNCRSFLSPWKDENGNYKWEGRFNQGVVSINLPQIGIIANGDEDKFWKLLDERLELCYEALMCRHKALKGTKSDISPIHWQYGGLARLGKGEVIDKYLENGYSTLSLGYIGIYETTYAMKGVSHTDPAGEDFAVRVMQYMKDRTDTWREKTGLGFSLYGSPAESLCYRFAEIDKKKFGEIKNITDKGYYTNSYHVDVREKIDAFAKLDFESQFQKISTGGCISYIEIPNMNKNLSVMGTLIKFIYEHIQYAEFNTKSDYCMVCGYDGEIIINDDNEWECPQCHNKDQKQMSVTRRTCGYLGANYWNKGKTKEIKARVLHL